MRLVGEVEEKPVYATGRPRADGTRKIKRMTYRLKISIRPREKAIARARKEAGCFVLITNEPEEAVGGLSSKELLRAYQDQHSVEQNFGFLKDPVFVNALFLKTPRRIEALGLILVLALMVWRLMERTMRISLKESDSKVVGWNNRKTSRPTSFMMTTKFLSVIVIRTAERTIPGRAARSDPREISPDPRTVGGCFHQSLRQRNTRWGSPDATAKRDWMRRPFRTNHSLLSLKSPPSQATRNTFVSSGCKNGVRHACLAITTANILVPPHSSQSRDHETKNYPKNVRKKRGM